jgi:transposase
VKAKTAAINQLRAVLVTAPPAMRDRYRGLSTIKLVNALTALQPGPEPTLENAVEATLRTLALRWRALLAEERELHALLARLVKAHAPKLLEQFGVGPDTAAALLITAGDNPDRLASEAAFAALCGASPIPAKSGMTDRHRLNRGGDRQANAALHRIVVVRLARDPKTKAYMAARRSPNRSNTLHVMRCLKRYLARELLPQIREALGEPDPKSLQIVA